MHGKNPFLVICYICGREFGSKSIAIHEKSCRVKFNKTQESLPKTQQSHPVKPTQNQSQQNQSQYNDMALQTYLESGRVECSNCARKVFLTVKRMLMQY